MAASPITPETTSSRCITEKVTASFNFEMTNYLQLKGMGLGEFVRSPVFRVGGYDWEMRFYPDGLNHDDCEGNASCFLRYQSQANDARARFAFTMMETKSQTEIASFVMTDHIFARGEEWGHKKFVCRSKLKSMSRAGDGCFTIRCVLTVMNESPPPELPGHLECMLGDDGRGADVTFWVDGHKFDADRALLAARSPVFAAQLFGPMAEKDMRHVEVVDMDPTIFDMMLRYIYTDLLMLPCSSDAPVMQHLLVAADRYALGRLKKMCEEQLCKMVDVETVTTMLALANQHHCERLKNASVAFMATDGFKKHLKTCASLERSTRHFLRSREPSIQNKYFLRSSKKGI